MESELKPCPWCQCDDLDLVDDIEHRPLWARYYVWCRNCAVAGPAIDTEDEAIELWNYRLIADAHHETRGEE